jgi:hypothetical protein
MALKTWSFFKEKSIRRVKCNGEKKAAKEIETIAKSVLF